MRKVISLCLLRPYQFFGIWISILLGAIDRFKYEIHSNNLFQLLSGIFQSTGWPAVINIITNWWGRERRGLIMGIWNSNTSIGNIVGSLVAGHYVTSGWGASFCVPGIMLMLGGILVFFTLDPKPMSTPQASIQNVLPYATLLFFCKLIGYTFLYWLPSYLTKIGNGAVSPQDAARLSIVFDFGGIFGGIFAGVVSDVKGRHRHEYLIFKRAATCAGLLAGTLPVLMWYQWLRSASSTVSLAVLFLCGALINGPFALITTAVSADLGTQPVLKGRAQALATVTAIIDSVGSFGAASGPLMAGILVPYGWSAVFTMLILADLFALIIAVCIVFNSRP